MLVLVMIMTIIIIIIILMLFNSNISSAPAQDPELVRRLGLAPAA